jgi:hypothetical protein
MGSDFADTGIHADGAWMGMGGFLTDASVHVPEPLAPPPDVPNPTYDEIAERALELCMRRHGAVGSDLVDWVNAERQLRLERHPQPDRG